MRAKMYIVLSLLIGFGFNGLTQTAITGKVNIGDHLPNYSLCNLINFPLQSVKLDDFKGKILILDFWSFGCASCVGSWPELTRLQKRFKDKVTIVTVNPYNTKNEIETFLKQREQRSKFRMTLPIVCGDKQLKVMFPHQTVPHAIFIDEKGIVKYINMGLFINEETLQAMIDDKELNIPEKTDDFPEVDRAKPLFFNGNIGKDLCENLLWSTIITRYAQNILSVSTIDSIDGYHFGWISNFPVKNMFAILYGKGVDQRGAVPLSRITFKNIDSTQFVMKVNGNYRFQNCYTIQVTSRKIFSVDEIKQKMISELEHYFRLKTRWIKVRKMSIVISRSKSKLQEYHHGEKKLVINSTTVFINKVTMPEFIDNLTLDLFYTQNYPIVDETNFSGILGQISFETKEAINYYILANELKKYGIKFSIEEREVDILEITKE